ncbi:MAG TPA: leucine-rich repeat domain-containing protein, partial [Mycobacterium sp.]|nr:leucine-rich repeat domain-containing protein [Mycobacterium sp.]
TGSGQPGWMITAAAPVACSGNIETLLDYATVDAGDHPAMADSCFASLFHACTALSSAPALPATNLTDSCYFAMFVGCRGLTEAPVLPATTLANNCCSSMFQACTGLTNAPALPATNLADHCYANMFYGCTGLTQAPALPATNLAGSCYRAMFANCTSLAEAPTLPATTMADSCCSFMFSDCTTLTTPPVLPATNLAGNCYTAMFSGCMGLTEAPTLPATTLAYGCYKEMFYGCTGLTSLPELSATTMADFCYRAMFYGCTGITLYEDGTAPTWGIPAGAQAAQYWNFDMLAGTGGTFTGDPVIGAIYYYTPPQVGVQVVFDATGGAFADGASAVTQVCVNVYGELPVAAREGYTLVGWFDGCTNGAAQAAAGGALLYGTAHTLHAHWTAVPGTTPASIFAYTVNADGTVTITGFRDPNQKVTKLVLPDMIDGRFVTAIAPGAFANSTSGMTEVFFPVFCTSIGSKAFLSVTTITHLEFPPTRDWRNPTQPANLHIGSYAFSGAKGLTALTLPAEVASLGDYAFNNAVNLKRITILGHPTLGKQVFRSVGNTPGGVTLHLDPALAGNATYMATLTSGMLNVTVETDAIITGLQIRAIGFAPSGRVVLGVTIERAAEWGAPDLASFRVKHRAQLGGASNVLVPVAAVLEADGSVTLEIPMPAGGNAFFRVFILN